MLDGFGAGGRKWNSVSMARFRAMPSAEVRGRVNVREIAAAKRGITVGEFSRSNATTRIEIIRAAYRKMVADGRLPPPDLVEVMRDA